MFDHQEVKVSSDLSAQQTEKFVLPIVQCKVVRRRQTQSVCGVINHQDRGAGSRQDGKHTHVVSSSYEVSLVQSTSMVASAKENCSCALIPLLK